METMAGMHRSCGCGLVTENDCGKELTLAGWVNTRLTMAVSFLSTFATEAVLYSSS